MKGTKKTSWVLNFFNVSIGENQISCFKINKIENDFMDNFYDA